MLLVMFSGYFRFFPRRRRPSRLTGEIQRREEDKRTEEKRHLVAGQL